MQEIHSLKLKEINLRLFELKEIQDKHIYDKAISNIKRDSTDLRFNSVESVLNKNDSSSDDALKKTQSLHQYSSDSQRNSIATPKSKPISKGAKNKFPN